MVVIEDFYEPCIKMSGDGDKGSCLHHHVLPVENPLPSIAVNNSVLLGVHQELGERELEEKCQEQEAGGASHSDQRDGQSDSSGAILRERRDKN